MSRDRCCVPGCVESGSSSTVLHGFPNPNKNPDLFRSWVYAVGGHILGLDNYYIYKLRRVCHIHFEEKYCCRFNRISNIAVPTINLSGPLALSRNVVECRPLRDKQNTIIDAPSCSKDPVIFASYDPVAIQEVEDQENISPIILTDADVDVINTSQRRNPILVETVKTNIQNADQGRAAGDAWWLNTAGTGARSSARLVGGWRPRNILKGLPWELIYGEVLCLLVFK